jgi:hypothetical protein
MWSARLGVKPVQAQPAAPRVEDGGLVLAWTAPEGCPDEGWVRREIERLIGRPLAADESPAIVAVAQVRERKEGGWLLRLRTRHGSARGLRELKARTCESLAEAAALILALSIDPSAVERRKAEQAGVEKREETPGSALSQEPTRDVDTEEKRTASEPQADAATPDEKTETEREKASEDESEEEAEDEPEEEPEEEVDEEGAPEEYSEPISVGFAFRLEALGEAGALPGVGMGMGAAAALLLDNLRLEGLVGYWPARQGHIEEVSSLGAELALLEGAAGVCYHAWGGSLSLAPCAYLELGSLYGEGFNVTSSLKDSALWVALLAGARAGWRLTSWGAFVLELGLAAPFLRSGYTLRVLGVTDRALVHRPSPLTPRLRVGIELQL